MCRIGAEFEQLGLSVPVDKPIQFSEIGIGGGEPQKDERPSPSKAAASPWEGTTDPQLNPWLDESMVSLRRQYHRALLQFLTTQPARWNVSAVFVWSMGSWNPVALKPSEFADDETTKAIWRHNVGILKP